MYAKSKAMLTVCQLSMKLFELVTFVFSRGKKVQNGLWAKYYISFTILGKVAKHSNANCLHYLQITIAKYLRSQARSIRIKVVNVSLQTGSNDCGLYTIVMMTSIAHNDDPAKLVYNQQEMRIHLMQCFEKGAMENFPVSKKRRLRNKRISKESLCNIYCSCRLPDLEDGSKMIMCENCKEWYHEGCIDRAEAALNCDHDWICSNCL